MLLGSSKNGRLELTLFSVPANSRTVSVILRDVKGNTSGLTAPDSFNTCPMCEGQRCEGQKWIFNVPTMLLWCREPKSLGLNSKDPAFLGLKLCWRLFVTLTQLGLDPPTTRLTVQDSSNCATLTPSSIKLPSSYPLEVAKANVTLVYIICIVCVTVAIKKSPYPQEHRKLKKNKQRGNAYTNAVEYNFVAHRYPISDAILFENKPM